MITFGTDGIRGSFASELFAPETLLKLGSALAEWMLTQHRHPKIIILSDTRNSCDYIKAALTTGLLRSPMTIVDAGVLPTPAAPVLMRDQHAQYALIISASHNPYSDNGIKIITAQGKLSHEDEITITGLLQHNKFTHHRSCGNLAYLSDATTRYKRALLKKVGPLDFKQKKIVLDTAHGATTALAATLFAACNAQVIPLNNNPNGFNINAHCGSVHPEQLQKTVLSTNAFCGFAFDGDGDRIIAVSADGSIKDGDDIMALLLQHPAYQQQPALVGTVMSNSGFEHYLSMQHKKLLRAQVGDKHVARLLEEYQLALGGEPSGHIILRDRSPMGDGLLVALITLETLVCHSGEQWPLLPRFPQCLLNIPIKHRSDLSSSPLKEIIQMHDRAITPGRILVRYSGTEPVLRIMTEAPTEQQALESADKLAKQLGAYLS